MSKFKAGDLALIVGAYTVTQNIGRQVELVSYVPPHGCDFVQDGEFEAGPEGLWVVRADGLIRNAEGGLVVSDLAGCAPNHLIPLRGDLQSERERETELSQ